MLVIRGTKLTLFPLRDETLESFWRDTKDVLGCRLLDNAMEELELSCLYLSRKMTDKLGPLLQQHGHISKISLQSCTATPALFDYFLRTIQSCSPSLECLESNGTLSDCWGPSTMQILQEIPLQSLRLLGMRFPIQQQVKKDDEDVEMTNADESSQSTDSPRKPLHQELQELDLTGCQWDQMEDSLLPLLELCEQSLQKVSFKCCRLEDAKLAQILQVLAKRHPKLHTIDLGVNQCGPLSLHAVASLVESSTTSSLEFLDLSYQVVISGGTSMGLDLEPLSQALLSMATSCNNNINNKNNKKSLKVLRLAGNQIRDDQLTTLAQALCHSTCRLERLDLSNNGISNQGLTMLSEGLVKNLYLKSLNLRNNGFVDLSCFQMEQNASLHQVQHSCPPNCPGSSLVEYVCLLNRGGRSLLRKNVPPGLWPKVLEHCCRQDKSDAIYHLLQQGQHR